VFDPAPTERADAARNRLHLLATAREIICEQGPDRLTMDGLAERAGLGKGTVFRRFRTRAGIFLALLDHDEREFQHQVLSGPPPLGPGAPPLERLIAYGRARTTFLVERVDIARAALDGSQPIPMGNRAPISQIHIRMLLSQLHLDGADLDMLSLQLAAALDGPILLYLSSDELTHSLDERGTRISAAWQDLVQRACRP
jgi:polyketide synthase 12